MKTPLALSASLCFYLSILFSHAIYAQNLVQNPSFEEIHQVRGQLELTNQVSVAQQWNSPNKGNPKLYTSNEEGNVHDEYGSEWKFKAKSGKHVAGIFVYGGGNNDYSMKRGYIQGSLSKPLEVGKKYYFSFWVHYHCEGSNKIGIAFLPQKAKLNSPGLIRMQAATYQAKVNRYSQKEAWSIVQDSFIAYKPFENFIIGNFFRNEDTQLESNNYGHHFAYIDDVSVEEAPNQPVATKEPDRIEMMKWEMNVMTSQTSSVTRIATPPLEEEDYSSPQLQAFFAKQIFFDLGSSQLRAEEREYLEVLVQQMKENPDFDIRIKGYASDEGSDPSNLVLSTARAEATKKFFRDRGINPGRLYLQALGEVDDPEDKELGKEYNRRVDFEIINK